MRKLVPAISAGVVLAIVFSVPAFAYVLKGKNANGTTAVASTGWNPCPCPATLTINTPTNGGGNSKISTSGTATGTASVNVQFCNVSSHSVSICSTTSTFVADFTDLASRGSGNNWSDPGNNNGNGQWYIRATSNGGFSSIVSFTR